MNSRALVLVFIIFSLLLSALLLRLGDLAWLALPFLVYLGLSLWQAPAAGQIRLGATRQVEVRRAPGRSAITVQVTLRNLGAALDYLYLADPHQPGMQLLEGQLRQPAMLRPGEEARFTYTFQAGRGCYAWKSLQAVIGDPFGLIETVVDVPAAAEIQVPPELRRIRPFPWRAQRTLPSAGSIPARRGGNGTNFWGIREYHPGDPLRRLDWRLTARHPRRFYTKEFEQEAIADIGLIVDARAKTNLWHGEDCLFEHSARAAASLAEVFLRQGNRVSLLVWGDPMISIFPGYGKVQLNRILRALAQTSPTSEGSVNDLHFVPIQMFPSHALIVVLSPLAANDWPLFPRLRAYGYQVLLICPDAFDYARPSLPTDQTTQLAARLARLEHQVEISKITRLWIPMVKWPVSQPLSPLVRQALGRAHIQLRH